MAPKEVALLGEILELKDVEGKTILHIAISENQTQAVSHLLALGRRLVNIEKNLEGKTALEILEGQRRQGVDNSEMRVILDRAGALTASSLPTVTSYAHYLRPPGTCERAKILLSGNQVKKQITDEKRNALLVVAALLVTVTFQAAITPPGGLWQDDPLKPNTTTAAFSPPSSAGGLLNESNSNITALQRAGSAIAKETFRFETFVIFSSLIFLPSIAVIVVLVPTDEIVGLDEIVGRLTLAGVSFCLCFCYFSSLAIITGLSDWSFYFVLLYHLSSTK